MEVIETRLVVALRRTNPGLSRGNRPAFMPIFQGDRVNSRWNLVAPPVGRFRVATLSGGDTAGPSPRGWDHDVYESHPLVAEGREIQASGTYSTEGLAARLVAAGLVATR